MTTSRWCIPLGVFIAVLAGCSSSAGSDFPELTSSERLYDTTGDSLSPAQTADVQEAITTLDENTGADTVVHVRALDASPEDTLDQVEELQQAWVAATGTDRDTAVAILINRNSDDPNDARAGIFVGTTFDDGSLPRDEQEAIVADALIPPLRDGDVARSLTAGLERLDTDITTEPVPSTVDELAAGAGSTWLPWAAFGLVLLGLAWSRSLYGRRETTDAPAREPTTLRPGTVPPAVGAALALRGPQPSSVPAAVLSLAARDALVIEPEGDGTKASPGKAQIRLLDAGLVRDEIERAVWAELDKRATDRVVSSTELGTLAAGAGPVSAAVNRQLRERGWFNDRSTGARTGLIVLAVLAVVLGVLAAIVGAAGASLLIVGALGMAVVALGATAMAVMFSPLSAAGQEAARPWQAYRAGLADAAVDTSARVDLDAALPDIVALNLGGKYETRLDAATEDGATLRAFASPDAATATHPGVFLPWSAFHGSFAAGGGVGGTGMVGGGGAGGGGGAAGST